MPLFPDVELSTQASADMMDILQHTLVGWVVTQRDAYADGLNAAFRQLAAYPYSGQELSSRAGDFRRLKVKEHVIYYVIRRDLVYIVRVLHHKMDIEGNLSS